MTTSIFDGLTVLEEGADGAAWRARVRVEATSRAFDGHFDGDPVLPGIAHLVIVGRGLSALGAGGLRTVPWVRFRQMVRPGDVLDVVVERAEGGRWRFEIRAGDALVAAGLAGADA
jgi:3-hydroxyacyl-[acyl-carrier-protein] dehydratase